MIDRHVYVGPNRVVWLRVDDVPALALASEHGGPTRRFDLRFHFSLGSQGWRERLKRAVYRRKVSALRRSRLSTLTYYAVYYPVWWHLESRAAGHPLHAAGVAIDGRALVLAGLPGAGKSTLAASLLTVPGAELLADNVVLHDGRQIYGCFEPVLLDEQTRAWLPQPPPLRALGRRHVFKRDAYHAPHRTDGLGSAISESPSRLVDHAVLQHAEPRDLHPHDIARFQPLARAPRRPHARRRPCEDHVARLERLLAGIPCYVLEAREGAPGEAVAALRDVMTPARQIAR